MSPVEELCARLDELGIEYKTFNHDSGTVVRFYLPDGRDVEYADFCWNETQLCVLGATPEQAIAATVGEECEMRICKRCGVAYELNIIDKGFGKPRFCPNCGHRRLYQ